MEDLDRVVAAHWHADTNAAHAWFTALCELCATAAATGEPVDLARGLDGVNRVAAESLLAVLADMPSPLDVLAEACRYGPDELTARYELLLARARVWNEFLVVNGPAWDGTEQQWPTFRDWFGHHAAQAGVGDAAAVFLRYVERGPDKIAAFAHYGVVIQQAPAQEPDDGFAEGDLAALFADPELDDIAAELATLDDAGIAALAAEISAQLGLPQKR